jgi:hypothetical protein
MFFLLSSFGQIKTIGFEKFSLIWSFLEFVGFRRYLQPVVEIVFFPSQCRTLFYLSIFPWACIIFFPNSQYMQNISENLTDYFGTWCWWGWENVTDFKVTRKLSII